jgi:hypothetical protein
VGGPLTSLPPSPLFCTENFFFVYLSLQILVKWKIFQNLKVVKNLKILDFEKVQTLKTFKFK